MPELDLVAVLHAGMLVVVKMCVPLLLAPLAAGLIVAIVQAVTQVSDSTLSFLPKLVATGAAVWLAGPFLGRSLGDFTQGIFDKIVAIGGQ
jgi:flagellar biosynthetic protein FliQ